MTECWESAARLLREAEMTSDTAARTALVAVAEQWRLTAIGLFNQRDEI